MVTSQVLQDRYRLEQELATGGMGVVYTATDERLGRKVAVKILKANLAQDPTFVERFRREARAAAALSHPNIANVFDYGEEEDRRFIVMELAEGVDLARLLREEGPLDPARAVAIATQVCEALAHAHSAGLIHRDVKPANIVIGPEDRVKVTDFGIARAVGSSTLTASGMVMGTANYLSPEQAQGSELAPPSDIYSLGVVLYEMVTGSVPFTADSPIGVALRHVNEELPAASALNPDVPAELDAVIARSTAKQPLDRFPDARTMRDALRPIGGKTTEHLLAPGAATTAALPTEGAVQTAALSPIVTRWNPQRLGAVVLIVFGVLFALAVALLIYRVAADEPPQRPGAGSRPQRGVASPVAPTPTPAYIIDFDELIERPFQELEAPLKERGLDVETVGLELDLIEKELGFDDPILGFVYHVEPTDGTALDAGDTITLFVASEEKEDEEDSEGPGNSEGKGHGKDKGEED